jgi:hypothetical protein
MQHPAPSAHPGHVADHIPERTDPDAEAGLLLDLPDDGLLGMLTMLDAAAGQQPPAEPPPGVRFPAQQYPAGVVEDERIGGQPLAGSHDHHPPGGRAAPRGWPHRSA